MTRGKRTLHEPEHLAKKRMKTSNSKASLKAEEEKKIIRRATTPPITDPSIVPDPNVNKVIYGSYEMGAWYHSPYPYEFGSFIEQLYICELCLRYMNKESQLAHHKTTCKARKPPGKVIYVNGKIKVYEIDGHEHKMYCQNLCLMAKLFLDNKTLYYDTDGFKFYVLTEQNSKYKSIDEMVGYFSKEKISYDGYNLACIMTLPSHQRKGYGRLLIELSYELSKHQGKIGSPEKPLSPLGSLGYQSYWASTIMTTLLHFRGEVTIKEISKETCIHEEDVIVTLSRLNLLAYRQRVNRQQNICISDQMLHDTLIEFNIKLGRKLDPENIRWK
ncbi:acyl-CoA N-acyltransferase [Mucor mucedo]|uniref:acyl-CoA N-acyltransferase n=1 Tax=Mucor mucedo TaxID=29922 RepID=UPI0022201049|nr:acyl-CoA N-acyltransferase [Mucor mucedo]KAI7888046.1 acyl-CoA N-acyltransferase [Mucor mucedo]